MTRPYFGASGRIGSRIYRKSSSLMSPSATGQGVLIWTILHFEAIKRKIGTAEFTSFSRTEIRREALRNGDLRRVRAPKNQNSKKNKQVHAGTSCVTVQPMKSQPHLPLQPKLRSDTCHGHPGPHLWLISHGYYIRSCATRLQTGADASCCANVSTE